jgi:hypothetical protein
VSNIPGLNLLKLAQKVIRATDVGYYQFLGRSNNAVGHWVSNYAEPDTIKANIQAVPREKYKDLGLDFTKKYIKVWAVTDFDILGRGKASDQVAYNGRLWEFKSDVDWSSIDSWNEGLAEDVGAVP